MGTPFFVLFGGLAAWGKGLPSASRLRAGHVPPAPPACGPTPCPPCAAAVPPPAPSSPLRGLAGEMWRPRPRLRRVLVKLAASRCAGAPLRKARPRQAAFGGPCFAPPPRRLRRRCSGAARPPLVGALGPSAPPARSAALRPALPARPRLRRRPGRSALPTHSPPGVAGPRPSPLSAAKPGRALRPAALPLRGPAICTAARTGGASAASSRIRARRGAGNAACGRECRPLPRPARPRQAPRRAASRPQAGALPASAPASDGQTWRVSRPLAGLPPSFHSGV